MNIKGISAVSVSKTNFRAVNKKAPNFSGIEKTTQKIAKEMGEAAANATGKAFSNSWKGANKSGTGNKENKDFLQSAFKTAKYIVKKAFEGISKFAKKISGFIKNTKKADDAMEGASKAEAKVKETIQKAGGNTPKTPDATGGKIIPFPKKADDAVEVIVAGRKYMFRPEKDKLPEGATIKDGVLMLDKDTKNNDPKAAIQKMREAIELAKQWGTEEGAAQPPTI